MSHLARIAGLAGLSLAVLGAPAAAQTQTAVASEKLERIEGFQRSYAASFFIFDACADGLAGRMFRTALAERFAQCPFSDAARAHWRAWSTAQRRVSTDRIKTMVEDHGGLLVKVEGMTQTCHERNTSADYIAYRAKLQQAAQHILPPSDVVAEPCDAPVEPQ